MAYETIAAALTGVPFPIDRQSLIEQIGSREVALGGGKNVTMRELLIACTEDSYETASAVTACPYITDALERRKVG